MYCVVAVIISSCNPKYYSPNTQNVPLLVSKGDGGLSVAGNGDRVEFQGSYGVSEQVGLQVNGGLFIPKDLDNGNGGSGNFVEGGIGYFKPMRNGIVFETYGLLGFGSFENHLPSTFITNPNIKGDISANLIRIGIQPSFGYKSKNIEAAISSRFASLNYSSIKGDLIFDNVNQATYLTDNKSNFVIEPAFTLRGGSEKIKLQLQLGFSFNSSNSDFRQDKSFGTVGLNYSFK